MKNLGKRYNENKPKLSMLFDAKYALEGTSKVLMHGEQKYSRGNWLEGLHWTSIMDSLLRHMVAFNQGENYDLESGLPHVDHITANAIFLAEMFHSRKDLDDRTRLMCKHLGDSTTFLTNPCAGIELTKPAEVPTTYSCWQRTQR